MASDGTLKLIARFESGEELEPAQLDEMTRRLRKQILKLDLESAEVLRDKRHRPGSMGDALTLGALALVAMPVAIPPLISFLKEWVLRGKDRKITIEVARSADGGESMKVQFPDDTSEKALEAWILKIQSIALTETLPSQSSAS